MFKTAFIEEAKELYPTWTELHDAIASGSGMIGRYLADAAETGICYEEILAASSLSDLKAKAMIIKRKNDLYHAYCSGDCYQSEKDRRANLGCPRLYAQITNDENALDAFRCSGVFHIPDCLKFHTGECWNRFDELGLQMQ